MHCRTSRFDVPPICLLAILGSIVLTPVIARAQEFGDFGNSDLTLLQELDRETQSLYQRVSPGVVRVEVPMTPPAGAVSSGAPTDPQGLTMRADSGLHAEVMSQPPSSPAGHAIVQPDTMPSPAFEPNLVGVVMDDAGDVLLPVLIDPGPGKHQTYRTLLSDGAMCDASFVAADQETHITVLHVPPRLVHRVALSATPPNNGALVVILWVRASSTRLGVWTNGALDSGVVVNADGQIAGFARRGQFLCCATCQPMVQQLIQTGHVHRAALGIEIRAMTEMEVQQICPDLRDMPALKILDVLPGSTADRAGLQVGDLILAMAGQPVSDPATFGAAIVAQQGPTQLDIARGHQHLAITVDLQPPPR